MSQIFLGGGCSLEEARSERITETEFVPCEGNLQIQAKAWQQEHGRGGGNTFTAILWVIPLWIEDFS